MYSLRLKISKYRSLGFDTCDFRKFIYTLSIIDKISRISFEKKSFLRCFFLDF